MKRWWLIILFFCYGGTAGAQQSTNNQVYADSLYQNFEEEQALKVYKEILSQDSTDFTALWRTSFLFSRIGNRKKEKETQKSYFEEAKKYAERALAVDSMHTQSNYVMAVAMGRKALVSGNREKVAASRAIKKYTEKAIKYDSTNAGAWHLLGRWNYQVANLSFFERLAASTLFGGVPGDASNEKAVDYIKRAISLDPKFVLYHHDLAMVLKAMDKKEQAVEACKNALQKQNQFPGDEKFKAECRQWIQEWK